MPISDKEMFERAVAPKGSPESAAPKEPEAEEVDQPVDEPDEVVTEPQAEKPAGEERPPRVRNERIPLPEYLSEREKRQAAEARATALEAAQVQRDRELADLRRERDELRRPKAAPVELPDPFADPAAYRDAIREQVRDEARRDRVNASFEDARDTDGPGFDSAYRALVDAGDPSLSQRIANAGNPGKALMRWHKERATVQEIGGDLNAYKARLRDEALKDPEFLKKAIEAARVSAGGNGQRQIPNIPSVNRASGNGGGNSLEETGLGSPEEQFQRATRR